MNCEKDDAGKYENTVDASKEISMQKALEILMSDLEAEKAKIKRPDISPWKGISKILITVFLTCIICFVLGFFEINPLYGLIFAGIVIMFNLKKSVIWLVLLYQKYAPERIRSACVFTPSCSEYMILAINKYGLLRGVCKGINRIFRCHHPNGGTDNP